MPTTQEPGGLRWGVEPICTVAHTDHGAQYMAIRYSERIDRRHHRVGRSGPVSRRRQRLDCRVSGLLALRALKCSISQD
jgi:hypothetical protein